MPKPMRSRVRGRPKVTDGAERCTRCGRSANRLRVRWPGDGLCNSCFYTAMRTYGICPRCGHDGVLPGRANRTDERPVCLGCAGIPGDYQCCVCGIEGELMRAGQCARCVLRGDLDELLRGGGGDQAFIAQLIDILCNDQSRSNNSSPVFDAVKSRVAMRASMRSNLDGTSHTCAASWFITACSPAAMNDSWSLNAGSR